MTSSCRSRSSIKTPQSSLRGSGEASLRHKIQGKTAALVLRRSASGTSKTNNLKLESRADAGATNRHERWLTGMGIEMPTAGEVRATACPQSIPTAMRKRVNVC